MENWQRVKVQESIADIDTCITELKIQILNNIDAQMVEKASPEEKAAVDTFVKKPILRVIHRLTGRKMVLMKLIQTVINQP